MPSAWGEHQYELIGMRRPKLRTWVWSAFFSNACTAHLIPSEHGQKYDQISPK